MSDIKHQKETILMDKNNNIEIKELDDKIKKRNQFLYINLMNIYQNSKINKIKTVGVLTNTRV